MAKFINVRDLTDASLFDADGFPLNKTKVAIREQRKNGTNSWNDNTRIERSIWNAAGEKYEAIERVPYKFDMPFEYETIIEGTEPGFNDDDWLATGFDVDSISNYSTNTVNFTGQVGRLMSTQPVSVYKDGAAFVFEYQLPSHQIHSFYFHTNETLTQGFMVTIDNLSTNGTASYGIYNAGVWDSDGFNTESGGAEQLNISNGMYVRFTFNIDDTVEFSTSADGSFFDVIKTFTLAEPQPLDGLFGIGVFSNNNTTATISSLGKPYPVNADVIVGMVSGSGPEDDMKVFLRKEIPLDSSFTLGVETEGEVEWTVVSPSYDIQFDIDITNYNYIPTLESVTYEIEITCTWDNPLEAGTLTATKTIKDSSTPIYDWYDGPAVANKNIINYDLLSYNSEFTGETENKYLIPDFSDFKITTVGQYQNMAVPESLYPASDGSWSISCSYNNVDLKIIENTGNVSPFVVDDTATEDEMTFSTIVKPFTRSELSTPSVVSHYLKSYRTQTRWPNVIMAGIIDEVIRDLDSIALMQNRSELTTFAINNPPQVKCIETGKTASSASEIHFSLSDNSKVETIVYGDLTSVTGFSLVTDGLTSEDKKITQTIVEAQELPAPVLVNELEFNDTHYLDIRDILESDFGVDLVNDNFNVKVSKISEPGIDISYESYRLIIRRIDCPADDNIYVRCGYFWTSGNERYLYNDDSSVTMNNPAIVDNKIDVSTELNGKSLLSFSPILITGETELKYDFLIDTDTGEKSLTGLTNSYFFDGENIHLSSDVVSVDQIIMQPDSYIYIDTGLNVNPLHSWNRRYFTEYSDYFQTLTSMSIMKHDNFFSVFAYDQYNNPISGAEITATATSETTNIKLIDENVFKTEVTYTSNDEGRVTFYYSVTDSNLWIEDNELLINVFKGINLSKTVTFTNGLDNYNTGPSWSLIADSPSSVRVGSKFKATIKAFSQDNQELSTIDYTVYYKEYDNFGDMSDGWSVEEALQQLVDNIVSIQASKIGLYKVVIEPDSYSGKVIYFRSY